MDHGEPEDIVQVSRHIAHVSSREEPVAEGLPIVLWIDPGRGVSVQQQFFEPSSGNYRLAKYSSIKINQRIPDSVFKLKTTPNTKVVTPQT